MTGEHRRARVLPGDEAGTAAVGPHDVQLRADGATGATTTGQVTARVAVKGPDNATATLRLRWNNLARHPRAAVTGRTGAGSRVVATLPAP